MTITDARIEATRPSKPTRPGRSPEAMTALAGRIRALQRSEPDVVGSERLDAVSSLTTLQLQLERLSIRFLSSDHDNHAVLADTFALAQQVDDLARLWPVDAAANLATASAHHPAQHGSRQPQPTHGHSPRGRTRRSHLHQERQRSTDTHRSDTHSANTHSSVRKAA